MTKDTPITLSTCLDEIADLGALARYPDPSYRIAHCSSYDRASVTPDDPEGWFANNDRGPYIRKEHNQGREEYVIAEFDGPGCLSRLWTTDMRIMPRTDKRAPETAVARLYLDGADTPAVQGLFQDIFNGTGVFPAPFAHRSLSSAVSYFPVPFARSMKITLEGEPLYYNISARKYVEGTQVESFTMQGMQALSSKIKKTGRRLLRPATLKASSVHSHSKIAAGSQSVIKLPDGPRAIAYFGLAVETMDAGSLRGLVLRIKFDGVETVYCPIGEFFGCGPGLHPFASLARSVDANGAMHSRWVMPYSGQAEIAILNLDSRAHNFTLRASVPFCAWDDSSLYFHAGWRYDYPMPTRPMFDWNYVTVQGRGRYAGDTLTVHNPVEIWWGEGDEKIWVDDDRFPSIFGTGTEDYYGYAWGGQNRAFYEHPMHAQVRVDRYDKLWTGPIPEARNTKGISTELRNLVLDSVTFEDRLKYDMEVWHWEDCEMAYAAACFWYAAQGSTSNIEQDPGGVQRSMQDLRSFESDD